MSTPSNSFVRPPDAPVLDRDLIATPIRTIQGPIEITGNATLVNPPTANSSIINQITTIGYVSNAISSAISNLTGGISNSMLDTLKEVANALGNDPELSSNLGSRISGINDNVIAETSRAMGAEAVLQSSINVNTFTVFYKCEYI
jgi:hypothetical protein